MFVRDLDEQMRLRFKALDETSTVRLAAEALANPRVGLVVVRGPDERPTGVVSKSDLVRHLASIGRGVSVDEVQSGGMMNMIAALGCVEATSRSSHLLELVQIAASRLAPPAAAKPHLLLVGSNDQ